MNFNDFFQLIAPVEVKKVGTFSYIPIIPQVTSLLTHRAELVKAFTKDHILSRKNAEFFTSVLDGSAVFQMLNKIEADLIIPVIFFRQTSIILFNIFFKLADFSLFR